MRMSNSLLRLEARAPRRAQCICAMARKWPRTGRGRPAVGLGVPLNFGQINFIDRRAQPEVIGAERDIGVGDVRQRNPRFGSNGRYDGR